MTDPAEHRLQVSSAAVELRGVARRFGARWALRGVDLRVEPGSVVALRGHNGSGKTTLLRVCATLLRPSRGIVTVFGLDAIDDADGVRGLVAFLTHRAGLYEDLTAAENLRFAARMLGVGSGDAEITALLERVGLGSVAAERVRGFSSGMQRRLAFARVLLRRPALLLLDEPYASFDAEAVSLVNGFAREVAESGGAVLIATHDTSRASGVAEREVWLEAGRVVEAEQVPGSELSPASRSAGRVPSAERVAGGRSPQPVPHVAVAAPAMHETRNPEPGAAKPIEVGDGKGPGRVGSQPGTRNPRGARRVAP